jgi:hypothetical protein
MKEASRTTRSVAFFTKREVTGDEIKDSISAILLAYDYLDQLEDELAVPVHDRFPFQQMPTGGPHASPY